MAVRTIAETFDQQHKVDPVSGCWLWQRGKEKDGYGHFMLNGKWVKAHRHAYAIANGPIPQGLFVLHRCDTPACVNPKHLFLGTNLTNMQDMNRKGRGRRPILTGEAHGRACLTTDKVRELRKRAQKGETLAALARECGVTKQAVWRVVKRINWAHVP